MDDRIKKLESMDKEFHGKMQLVLNFAFENLC